MSRPKHNSFWTPIARLADLITIISTVIGFITTISSIGLFGTDLANTDFGNAVFETIKNRVGFLHYGIRWSILYLFIILSSVTIKLFIKEHSQSKVRHAFALGTLYLATFWFIYLGLGLHIPSKSEVGLGILIPLISIFTPLLFQNAAKSKFQVSLLIAFSLVINTAMVFVIFKEWETNETFFAFIATTVLTLICGLLFFIPPSLGPETKRVYVHFEHIPRESKFHPSKVFIDGVFRTTTDRKILLRKGYYEFRFESHGYYCEKVVDLQGSETIDIYDNGYEPIQTRKRS